MNMGAMGHPPLANPRGSPAPAENGRFPRNAKHTVFRSRPRPPRTAPLRCTARERGAGRRRGHRRARRRRHAELLRKDVLGSPGHPTTRTHSAPRRPTLPPPRGRLHSRASGRRDTHRVPAPPHAPPPPATGYQNRSKAAGVAGWEEDRCGAPPAHRQGVRPPRCGAPPAHRQGVGPPRCPLPAARCALAGAGRRRQEARLPRRLCRIGDNRHGTPLALGRGWDAP